MFKSISIMARMFALMGCAVIAAQTWAQPADYPSRPIRLIVPFPAGGGTDFFARTVAKKMSDQMGQSIVIENRSGAASMIGAQAAATSAPDGYTILLGDMSTLAVNPSLYKSMSYDPRKDFFPISLAGRFELLLVVHPGIVRAKTVTEFIAEMNQTPQRAFYATVSPGTAHHLAMELFKQQTGMQSTAVHYKGAAPAVQELLAGQVPAMFLDLAAGASYIKSGRLRALGVASSRPLGTMPELPTLASSGVPGFEAGAWQALMAPHGTPREIIARLNAEYAKAVADPELRKKLSDAGIDARTSTPEEASEYISKETAKWAKVITTGNIKVE